MLLTPPREIWLGHCDLRGCPRHEDWVLGLPRSAGPALCPGRILQCPA
jgi:hypothetical protein